MKRIISLVLIIASFTAFSQTTEAEDELKAKMKATDSGWKTGGVVNVNFSQAAYSKYYAVGTENSMTLTTLVSIFANFSDGANIWDNNLDLGYGFLKQGGNDLVKSEDKIDLTSKYGRKALESWYYAALFNFKSQMTPTTTKIIDDQGEEQEITLSEFMSPGTVLFAVGMDYKPNNNLTAFISPVTYRSLFMKDIDTVSDFGGYMRVKYTQEVFTNINFESKFEAFSNYDKDPQNLFITWDNLLSMKVNEYVSANVSFGMINTPGMEVQYKEVLGVGISYVF